MGRSTDTAIFSRLLGAKIGCPYPAAEAVAKAGGSFLRGGAFKPRTSPYAFEGHGAPALSWLRHAADACDLRVVTEVMSEMDVSLVSEHADVPDGLGTSDT